MASALGSQDEWFTTCVQIVHADDPLQWLKSLSVNYAFVGSDLLVLFHFASRIRKGPERESE